MYIYIYFRIKIFILPFRICTFYYWFIILIRKTNEFIFVSFLLQLIVCNILHLVFLLQKNSTRWTFSFGIKLCVIFNVLLMRQYINIFRTHYLIKFEKKHYKVFKISIYYHKTINYHKFLLLCQLN